MATYEHAALMQYKDRNGDMHITYPITKAENVDGLYGDAALTGVPTAPTAAPGTNTAQVATTAFVQQELEDVKKSVSDGKTAVANAITAKGVTTATDATFDTMAANISAIESGSGIGLNVFTQETEPETKEGVWVQTANPHQSILIGSKTYENKNVSLTISGWTSAPALPFNFYNGSVVVYNGEIHIMNGTNHYAFNGTSWRKVSTLPYTHYGKSVVVYNNEIHMMYKDNHYAFNGSSWRKASTLPYKCLGTSAVVYNGEIHILGGHVTTAYDNRTKHYAFNGTSWREVSVLPYRFNSSAIVYNNEIHILGGYNSGSSTGQTDHYKFNGASWNKVSTLPYNYNLQKNDAVVYNDELHILGGDNNHYRFNGASWNKVSTLPYSLKGSAAVVYNGKIHILGGDDTRTNHYMSITELPQFIGTSVAIYQNPENASGTYATNFISGVPITGENNKFPSGFDDVYYIDDSGNVEESPTYYGDGTQWIKFKN